MRFRAFFVIFPCILSLLIYSAPATAAQKRMLIKGVSLISADVPGQVRVRDVLLEGERIKSIGKDLSRKAIGASLFEGAGFYLTPGLIDSHTHLQFVAGMIPAIADKHPELVEAYYEQLPRSYLYFGFTTVVDLAIVDNSFLEKFQSHPVRPDVFHCGPPVPIFGGYPMFFWPEATRLDAFHNFLYDPRQSASIPAKHKPENHSPKAVAQRVKQSGAICMKTFYEPGWGRAKWTTPTKEMLQRLRSEARKRKLKFIVHANSYDAQRVISELGPDMMAHGMWNWGQFDGKPGIPKPIRKVLDTIVEKDIQFMPTIRVLGGIRDMFDPSVLGNPQMRHVIPEELLAWYQSDEAKYFLNELIEEDGRKHDAGFAYQALQKPMEQGMRVVRYLSERGASIIMGSDTPGTPSYANPPGYTGYQELALMAEAGMPLERVFASATVENAKAFGIAGDVGTIERGKLANMLLLRENPLVSVRAYDSIVAIFLRGKMIDRRQLSASHPKAPAMVQAN